MVHDFWSWCISHHVIGLLNMSESRNSGTEWLSRFPCWAPSIPPCWSHLPIAAEVMTLKIVPTAPAHQTTAASAAWWMMSTKGGILQWGTPYYRWFLWTGKSHLETGWWWFGTFVIFPYIWNNHPNWRSYFSEGWPNHQPGNGWCKWGTPMTMETTKGEKWWHWNVDQFRWQETTLEEIKKPPSIRFS